MKARRITLRLTEADFENLRTAARDHGQPVSEYARALLTAAGHAPATLDDDRLARIETLALAAAVSAYEAQSIARAGLTPEQAEKMKKHRAGLFAAWRAWGVKSAYIGLDMRPEPNHKKEEHHE
jgi:uncharacterized protein (DUF1778 family)